MTAYWQLVARRAFAETCNTFGMTTWGKASVRAALAIVPILLLWTLGSKDDALGSFRTRMAATAALLLLFPAVLLVQLMRVPALLHAEDQARLAVVADKQMKQALIDELARLYQMGRRTFEARVTSEEDFANWKKTVHEWLGMVSTFLREKISIAQQISFDQAQGGLTYGWDNEFNPEHQSLLNHMHSRLNRLQIILDGMQR